MYYIEQNKVVDCASDGVLDVQNCWLWHLVCYPYVLSINIQQTQQVLMVCILHCPLFDGSYIFGILGGALSAVVPNLRCLVPCFSC